MSRTILITGATSGFGEAIARKFAANKYRLIITGRREDRLKDLEDEFKKDFNTEVLALCFDVRDRKAVESVFQNLPAAWKNIDILVNNAGLAAGLDFIDEGSLDDWDQMIDTNVKGLLYITRQVTPLMRKQNSGHIFNIGSVAGKYVYEKGNVYCATKFAVDALSQAMRIDMLKYNIRVTAINPGMAETEFSLVRYKGDKQRADAVYKGVEALKAEDIADIIYYCAALPAHVCINDLTVSPTAQASPFYLNKNTTPNP